MIRSNLSNSILGLFSLFLCVGVVCAEPTKPMVEHTKNGIRFMTGGVGLGEREELKAVAGQYSCRIEMAHAGKYVCGADLRILDAAGKELLKSEGCGPWFLVDLTPGKYTVVICHKNKEIKHILTVEEGRKSRFTIRF